MEEINIPKLSLDDVAGLLDDIPRIEITQVVNKDSETDKLCPKEEHKEEHKEPQPIQTSFSFMRSKTKKKPEQKKEVSKNNAKLLSDNNVKLEEEKEIPIQKKEEAKVEEVSAPTAFHFNQKAKRNHIKEEKANNLQIPVNKPLMSTSVNELTIADMGENFDDDNDYPFDDGWKCIIA